jgi:hypothetical protein
VFSPLEQVHRCVDIYTECSVLHPATRRLARSAVSGNQKRHRPPCIIIVIHQVVSRTKNSNEQKHKSRKVSKSMRTPHIHVNATPEIKTHSGELVKDSRRTRKSSRQKNKTKTNYLRTKSSREERERKRQVDRGYMNSGHINNNRADRRPPQTEW